MNRSYMLLCLLVIMTMLLHQCSTDLAGGSSDHGNARVIGTLHDSSQAGVTGALVRLLPTDYNPISSSFSSDSLIAFTDESGQFVIDKVPQGMYTLCAEAKSKSLYCFHDSIICDEHDCDTINKEMENAGQIIVPIDSSLLGGSTGIAVFIPGTPYYLAHQQDSAHFMAVPPGFHAVMAYESAQDTALIIHQDFQHLLVMAGIVTNLTVTPVMASGPQNGRIHNRFRFHTMFEYWHKWPDLNVNYLEYRFSWGDRDTSSWSGNLSSRHSWRRPGSFNVRVQMRYLLQSDIDMQRSPMPFYSGWSPATPIVINNRQNDQDRGGQDE